MEFEEVFMSPVTTPTTCYSGANNGKCSTIRLATENDLLGVNLLGDDIQTTAEQFPPSNLICVGFSQWDDNTHAMAFVNTFRVEDDGPTLSRMSVTDRDDTDGSIGTAGGALPSTNSVGAGNRSLGADSSVKAPSPTETPVKRESLVEDDENDASTRIEARLVLQTERGDYSAALGNFRPLSPCVARWGTESIGVWLGSSDDELLRLYIPNESDHSLQMHTLTEKFFVFKTPVMAIDFISHSSSEVLAVACQDGSIQLIYWKGDLFENLSQYQVFVDGPILSLQLYALSESVEVLVGSLCGYVCRLSRDGPTMVVQGYRNEAIHAEDSVLAVHFGHSYLAVGTHGGRCVLYTHNTHVQIWECLLPYSVHSIVSHGMLLLVTTRRSIHVFRQTKCDRVLSSSQGDTKYSVERARSRLLKLVKEAVVPPKVDDEGEDGGGAEGGDDHDNDEQNEHNDHAEQQNNGTDEHDGQDVDDDGQEATVNKDDDDAGNDIAEQNGDADHDEQIDIAGADDHIENDDIQDEDDNSQEKTDDNDDIVGDDDEKDKTPNPEAAVETQHQQEEGKSDSNWVLVESRDSNHDTGSNIVP
eukprot:scaffold1390_cov138-Cylindrotheca_fusiformis.AAC.23